MAKGAGDTNDGPRGAVRCAVYTRKSNEEGLEQEYNSLDAQFDACCAYIASQRHEGWTPVRDRYDDGGFSGGSMERPALKRLLVDVAAGRVHVIVLYKIDRLTRSLADFARIIEVLDQAGASFVSVTQSFNTTTSMGRLMLNVLLSFAQFEREVTGERIRDKIAMSKAKGMWMGGPVPLGYMVQDRKLIINELEAATVRHIFERYVALGTGQLLIDELRERGYRTAKRVQKDGRTKGGVPFERGALFHLLGNRIYRGSIIHKGADHAGEHDAIIDETLWNDVQQRLEANRVNRSSRRTSREVSLLAGIITDGLGRRMTPSHSVRDGKRYRYYVTHGAALTNSHPAWRLPAHEVERAVVHCLAEWCEDSSAIREAILSSDAGSICRAISQGSLLAERLRTSTFHRRAKVAELIRSVKAGDQSVTIELDHATLEAALECPLKPKAGLELVLPACRVRKGNEVKLVFNGGASSTCDRTLAALLDEAITIRERLIAEQGQTITGLAATTGQCRKRLTQLVALSWLSPKVVEAVIDGTQPAALTHASLLGAIVAPSWVAQVGMFSNS
ncbi:recombinase family protein [Parablastomonas sp. CN1-191]|uniref:recombinase family protein n=1 Tax=Parablastomonas sp. CN1-191 TaxID=3400908 RepID=UPI003BF85F25